MREKETFWYPCPDCGEKMLKDCKDTKIITEIEPLSKVMSH